MIWLWNGTWCIWPIHWECAFLAGYAMLLDAGLMAEASSCAQGSSTACILALEGDTLHAANLGDSGFMVVRKSKVMYKSRSQQHQFNYPFQLGRGGRFAFDPPAAAEVSHSAWFPVPLTALLVGNCTAQHSGSVLWVTDVCLFLQNIFMRRLATGAICFW